MAHKGVVEVRAEPLSVNAPWVKSCIGSVPVPSGVNWLIDDSVGPFFSLHIPEVIEEADKGFYVAVTVELESKSGAMSEVVYTRRYLEYLRCGDIMRRYRVPFEQYELQMDYRASHAKPGKVVEHPPYCGNPRKECTGGNVVRVWLRSPWKIDPVKSDVRLRFIELTKPGRIGPKEIKVF